MKFNNVVKFKDILEYNKDEIKANQEYFDKLYESIKDTVNSDYSKFKKENKDYSTNYTISKLDRAFRSFKEFFGADVEYGNPYFISLYNDNKMSFNLLIPQPDVTEQCVAKFNSEFKHIKKKAFIHFLIKLKCARIEFDYNEDEKYLKINKFQTLKFWDFVYQNQKIF